MRFPSSVNRLRFHRMSESRRISLFELGSTGKNVKLTGWPNFGSEPFLISIGNDVTISSHVSFVTHDGGTRVLRRRNPGLHVYGRIVIGNNCFIGMRTIILPGVTIGDDVVIGAGSVVTKDVPSRSVAAGVPCRVLKNLDDYEASSISKGFIWRRPYDDNWRNSLEAYLP
ncbi:acyltransferase [Rhodococcoides kroppenstedtii]|uniref:acyltransferase n=1 Tax=Rhodococcoides kroppenstedtii TaxID=293050 RepID=UPI001BDEB4AB|nr:acyltransferase [Rhodococcus kroppenstedtii]MBT1191862.1 acyltransferase [Rhodococcus kroppenstedtii]